MLFPMRGCRSQDLPTPGVHARDVMSNPIKPSPTTKVTGALLCRDRVAIHFGGAGKDAIKALHGAASVFAEGELQGLLAGAIADDLFGAKVAIGVDPLLEFFSTQRIVKGVAWAGNLLQEDRPRGSRYAFLIVGTDEDGRFFTHVEVRDRGSGRFEVNARPATSNEIRRLPRNPSGF